jgi:hypothetical protein
LQRSRLHWRILKLAGPRVVGLLREVFGHDVSSWRLAVLLAAVRQLNQVELVGESVRACVEAIAAAAPDWAQACLDAGWQRRYGARVDSWRMPASKTKRAELGGDYARDGVALLRAVWDPASPSWLAQLPAVGVLQRVLIQNVAVEVDRGGREVIRLREADTDGLPPGRCRIVSPGLWTPTRPCHRRRRPAARRLTDIADTRNARATCGLLTPSANIAAAAIRTRSRFIRFSYAPRRSISHHPDIAYHRHNHPKDHPASHSKVNLTSAFEALYEDVRRLLADPRLSSSLDNLSPELAAAGAWVLGERIMGWIATCCGRTRRHILACAVVDKAFTPGRIERLRPRVQEVTEALLRRPEQAVVGDAAAVGPARLPPATGRSNGPSLVVWWVVG